MNYPFLLPVRWMRYGFERDAMVIYQLKRGLGFDHDWKRWRAQAGADAAAAAQALRSLNPGATRACSYSRRYTLKAREAA